MTSDDATACRTLETRILEEIRLARHLGVRVESCSPDSVLLSAPLAANSNHHGTVFGGSLFAVAVLAGWGLLTRDLEARGIDAEIVIQDSRVEFRLPVEGDFTARARLPDAAAIARCTRTLARYGRARLEIPVVIEYAGEEAVRLVGTYAIRRAGRAQR